LKDVLCAFAASSHNSDVVGEPSFSTKRSRIWDGAEGDGVYFFKQTNVCLKAMFFLAFYWFNNKKLSFWLDFQFKMGDPLGVHVLPPDSGGTYFHEICRFVSISDTLSIKD
jgi:hypothetical protein